MARERYLASRVKHGVAYLLAGAVCGLVPNEELNPNSLKEP